jgi:hypothetical protein
MMKLTAKILPLIAATGLAFAATPALADTIPLDASKVGSSYTFNFNGFSGGTVVDGLTSSATFTLTGVASNSYTFDYSLTNTTSGAVDSRVSSFAFNTDPSISSASATGAFSYATLDSSYPNGIGAIDVCFKDAVTGSCAGGGSGGLLDGETGTGTFTLNFSQPLTSLTLSDFYVRYQSVSGAGNITSASGAGTLTSGGSSSGGTSVPEPGMLGLMGGAAAALVLLRRRRQTVRRAPAFA